MIFNISLPETATLPYNRGKRCGYRDACLQKLLHIYSSSNKQRWNSSIPTYLKGINLKSGLLIKLKLINIKTEEARESISFEKESERFCIYPETLLPISRNSLICMGDMSIGEYEGKGRKKRVTIEGLKYYNSGWDKFVVCNGVRYHYKRQRRARLMVEAYMNELSYEDYIWRLKNDPTAICLKSLSNDMVVHHMDENPMNDNLSNLEIITKLEHDTHHGDYTRFNQQRLSTTIVHPMGRITTPGFVITLEIDEIDEPVGLVFSNDIIILLDKAVKQCDNMVAAEFENYCIELAIQEKNKENEP